jgi:CheY-like chemotaxis protein
VDEGVGAVNDSDGALDCAVLDINLHGLKSYPIADALKARNIPFVFTTGYSGEAIPDAYRSFPRYEKPFNPERLITALSAAKRHTS